MTIVTLQNHLHLTRRLAYASVAVQSGSSVPPAQPRRIEPAPRIQQRITVLRERAAGAASGPRATAVARDHGPWPAPRSQEPPLSRPRSFTPAPPQTSRGRAAVPAQAAAPIARPRGVPVPMAPRAGAMSRPLVAWPRLEALRRPPAIAHGGDGATHRWRERPAKAASHDSGHRAADHQPLVHRARGAAANARVAPQLALRWRITPASARSEGAATSPAGGGSPHAASPAAEASPVAGRAVVAATPPSGRVVPAPVSFDGPAIDRLADNVMQRIERRIRIERERRGL